MFRRMNWIINHVKHLGSAEIGWLISRLKVEYRETRAKEQASAKEAQLAALEAVRGEQG